MLGTEWCLEQGPEAQAEGFTLVEFLSPQGPESAWRISQWEWTGAASDSLLFFTVLKIQAAAEVYTNPKTLVI